MIPLGLPVLDDVIPLALDVLALLERPDPLDDISLLDAFGTREDEAPEDIADVLMPGVLTLLDPRLADELILLVASLEEPLSLVGALDEPGVTGLVLLDTPDPLALGEADPLLSDPDDSVPEVPALLERVLLA